MNNQEILTKAIEKAIDGGCNEVLEAPLTEWRDDFEQGDDDDRVLQAAAFVLIFNHDFAKALWGEQGFPGEFTGKYPNPVLGNGGAQRGWQYHLQQMVIADDPIKYLGENI